MLMKNREIHRKGDSSSKSVVTKSYLDEFHPFHTPT
jgi:hypothetical protein